MIPILLRVSSRCAALACFALSAHAQTPAQPAYDLLLRGGHVIDAKNGVSAIRDVAIKDGAIAAVAPHIDPASAFKSVDVSGMYVTPGLVDMHVHVYAGTGERASWAGDLSVYPDGFTLRNGVTTVADAGSSGWRNFPDFKDRVIDRAKTRVLAFLNIVGNGMRGTRLENDVADMQAAPAAEMALRYKGLIAGFKTAHYAAGNWTAIERAVEAGNLAKLPIMVDYGTDRPERPLAELLTTKLRPGDIYTHCYSGVRHELDDAGKVNPGMIAGRRRGVIFDVGHGGGSFAWRVAIPAIRQGFLPDSISSDLHVDSMNTGMKDILNVMDKFLAMGLSLEDVIARTTWNPAREIHHEELGHLTVGAPADVAVLSLQSGRFGFTDMYGAKLTANRKLVCEVTIRAGKVVFDLNGTTRPEWEQLPPNYRETGDARWDDINPRPGSGRR